MFDDFGINAGFVEDLHAQYRQSPQSVEEHWREFFDGLDGNATTAKPANGNGVAAQGKSGDAATTKAYTNGSSLAGVVKDDRHAAAAIASRVQQLVNAYRVRGHLFARIDPLGTPPDAAPELDLANFDLTEGDLGLEFPTVGIGGMPARATLRQIIEHLSETYCSSIGVEYTHVEDPEARDWLQSAMETSRNKATLDNAECVRILKHLTDAEIFEQFVHKNFVGAKRFSCEGAESMIAMLDLLIEYAATGMAVEEIVIGMAHRGRLNVLANIMNKNVREIFAAFRDSNPERNLGRGDVKYHLGESMDRPTTSSGRNVHLSLAFNPSHLEFVNPVVEGRVRAKQDKPEAPVNVVPLLIHGDAAFMGQGVIPETLNMAGLEGYATGGTVHLVVNNQIGFTTLPQDSRSTRYCTDITRMMKVPVFHVNGEDPEAVIQVGAPRHGVPPAVRQGRRHRHALLPPLRPQRRRRAPLHPAGDVQAHRPEADGPRGLRQEARRERADHARTRAISSRPNRQAALALRRSRKRRRATTSSRRRRWKASGRRTSAASDKNVEEVTTRVSRRTPSSSSPARLSELPADFKANPKVKKPSSTIAPRARAERSAPSTGAPPSTLAFASARERKPRWFASPGRTRAAGRSRTATRRSSMPPPGRATRRSQNLGSGSSFEVHDSAALGGGCPRLRVRLQPRPSGRARHLGGAVRRLRERRAGHHRPVHRVGRRTSGSVFRASCSSSPTATKAKDRSTPAPASSVSSSSRRRTTSRSAT